MFPATCPMPAGTVAKVAGDLPDALTSTLVLRRDDEAGFRRYLHDPASPHYRYFLGAAQLADRFGPAPAGVATVLPATASSAVRVLRDSIFADGFDAP